MAHSCVKIEFDWYNYVGIAVAFAAKKMSRKNEKKLLDQISIKDGQSYIRLMTLHWYIGFVAFYLSCFN